MYKAFATDCNGFPLSFEETVKPLSNLGCEGFWFNIVRDSRLGVEKTLELMDRYRQLPAGFGLPVEFRKDEQTFQADIKQLDQYLSFADGIGLKRTMTWIVPGSDDLDYAQNFELHKTRLRQVARKLSDHGIRFGLEFVGPPLKRKGRKYPFIHTLDGVLELLDAIGADNAGILLDIWHWYLAGQTAADYGKLKSEKDIVLVHINDAPRNIPIDEQVDGARALPGSTGVLPIEEMFSALQKLDYAGPVVAEPFVMELAKRPFEEAAGILMKSMDDVWPKGKQG